MSKKTRRPLKAAPNPGVVYATNGHLPAAQIARMLQPDAQAFQEQKDEYKAGLDASDQNNRFMRYRVGLGGGGDAHMHQQRLWYVRETCRHMVLNDDLVGQMLMRLADNIVQDQGFRLVCSTGDDALDDELEARTVEWGENPNLCDFYGERTWRQLQWIAQFQIEQDGDIFGLPVDNGTLQLIEAERCATYQGQDDYNYLGLQFTTQGKCKGYTFTEKPLGPFQMSTAGPTKAISRWDSDGLLNVFHMHDSRRVTQHRGLPWLTPAMIKMGMLDDLQFAMLVKAQSCAAHAAVIERTEDVKGQPPQIGQRGTPIQTAAPDGTMRSVPSDALKYGATLALPYGYKLGGFSPSIPNAEFFQHARESIRQISATLSMPIEMTLLDASQTNYSGWRGAMDQARMSFRRWQSQLINQLHSPMHKFNCRRWAFDMKSPTARRLLASGDIYKHKWVPPAWPYINPKDDADAGKALMASGQASPRGLAASRGDNYDEIVDETIEDRATAIRKAIVESEAIKKELNWEVDPLVILGWDLPANSALITQTETMQNAKLDAAGNPMPGGPNDAPSAPKPAVPGPKAPIRKARR